MRFGTAAEAFSHLESLTNLEKAPNLTAREYRLDRMAGMLPLFDYPQNSFRSIHIAGSKGKGSTAAFTAASLSANGFRTGLYASPHVASYKERITLNGVFFDDRMYADTASEMIERLEDARNFPGGPPTTFELLTLLSFLIFRKTGCEWAVFETGMGGRLDATNVLQPEAVILTPIELEHTEYLGDTIEKIAGEKAGIIKPGVPVFSSKQLPEAESVFRKRAGELLAPVFFDEGWTVDKLRAAGIHQKSNAGLAARCLRYLVEQSVLPAGFSPETGMSETVLPGRMEMIVYSKKGRPGVRLVFDGAHTRSSVQLACDTFFSDFVQSCPGANERAEPVLVFGAVDGKDAEKMAEVLVPRFRRIIISTPGTFKKSNPAQTAEIFKRISADIGREREILLETAVENALNRAVETASCVLITGSFYMVAEIRKLVLPRSG